jgi:flagellar assembly factor FliW
VVTTFREKVRFILKLQTDRFGEIDINEEGIVIFENGLPGFEDLKQFVFIQENAEQPFAYMQSVEDGEVSFIIVNPFIFFPDYEFDITDADQAELQVESEEDVHMWVVMSVIDTLENATLNLLAPLIINFKARLGKQIILHNSSYHPKHFLNLNGS